MFPFQAASRDVIDKMPSKKPKFFLPMASPRSPVLRMGLRTKIYCCIALLTTVLAAYRNYTNLCRILISNILTINVSNLDWCLLLCLDRATAVQVHLYLSRCNSFQSQTLSCVANIATSDCFSTCFWPELLATSPLFEFWGLAKLLTKPKMKCKSEVTENSANGTFHNKVTQAST